MAEEIEPKKYTRETALEPLNKFMVWLSMKLIPHDPQAREELMSEMFLALSGLDDSRPFTLALARQRVKWRAWGYIKRWKHQTEQFKNYQRKVLSENGIHPYEFDDADFKRALEEIENDGTYE